MLEGEAIRTVILVVIGTILSWALRSVIRRCWKTLSCIWLSRSYDFNYWYGEHRYYWRLDQAYYARYDPSNKEAPATVEVVFWGLLYYARVRSHKTPKRKIFWNYKKAAEWIENYIYPEGRPNPYSKPVTTGPLSHITNELVYSEEDIKKGRGKFSSFLPNLSGHNSYPKVVFLGRNSQKLARDGNDFIKEELDRGGGPHIRY